MMQPHEKQLLVTWRGKKFVLEMKQDANLKELGDKLQQLTNVKVDTLRLIVPTTKGSKMLYPFSDEHSYLPLEAAGAIEGKPIRMMGVPENEVEEVLQSAKTDLRIAGFDEEEKRMRQRILDGRDSFVQLPKGTYIFSEFRTLSIPGIELSPPPAEALKLMHRLAADPGIVAIMNKHQWRVGIMTEMAPVGYVGVSPKCLLGFNKNHGEEISLRLRTDDLNGFRKYESIKKTLLHELAHMVYSEHDANFYALDKQLNQEAADLDWTKTKGHSLNGIRHVLHAEDEFDNRVSLSRKLGGLDSGYSNARASSVAAAYRRFADMFSSAPEAVRDTHEEPDPDDSKFIICQEPDSLHAGGKTEVGHANVDNLMKFIDEHKDHNSKFEPDPDDSEGRVSMESEPYLAFGESRITSEPDPDDSGISKTSVNEQSDLNNLRGPPNGVGPNFLGTTESAENLDLPKVILVEPEVGHANIDNLMKFIDEHKDHNSKFEPDPDDSEGRDPMESEPHLAFSESRITSEPDPDDSGISKTRVNEQSDLNNLRGPPNGVGPNFLGTAESNENLDLPKVILVEPDPDDSQAEDNDDKMMAVEEGMSIGETDEPDPDDLEIKRIQDPVTEVYGRLQKAMKMLRSEVNPLDAGAVLQTLSKIIRNVIEHPNEMKFRKIRKANTMIQKNVLRYRAAAEVLHLVGFSEDVIFDEMGKAETYLALKRNDPGLLWLVKSSLESFNT